jgi:hypothetical protein
MPAHGCAAVPKFESALTPDIQDTSTYLDIIHALVKAGLRMEGEEVAATKNLGVRKSWRSPLGSFTARAQQFWCLRWAVLSFYTLHL